MNLTPEEVAFLDKEFKDYTEAAGDGTEGHLAYLRSGNDGTGKSITAIIASWKDSPLDDERIEGYAALAKGIYPKAGTRDASPSQGS